MKHGRRDGNHARIRDGLRDAGYRVQDLGDVGDGCPDLLVGGYGRLVLLEVKDPDQPPSKRKLTPDEVAFFQRWQGFPVYVVETLEGAIAVTRPRPAQR